MKHGSRKYSFGTQGTRIILAAFFGVFTCLGMAAAEYSEADDAAFQDCLFRAMETSPGESTIDDLRAKCQSEELTATGEDKASLIQERIYTDTKNVLRPFTLMSHKPNFILLACYNNSPNNDPWREASNDSNLDLDKTESQFQLSIKVPLAIDVFDRKIDFFGAYTVRSYWQVYNSDLSAPFRETNYQPEGWLQFRNDWSFWGIDNVVNQFGIMHQSNGRNEPISRSWNRIYANFIFEKGNLIFSIRPWYRLPEKDKDDNNKDITDYLGHCEFLAAYKWHRNTFSVMTRNNLESGFDKGAVEAAWSFPLWNYRYLKGYIQGFHGYGQSLIDYDSKETSIGIGFAMTDFL